MIRQVGRDGITALLTPSLPRRLVVAPAPGSWQVDPLVLDGVMQLCSLWARGTLGMTALPASAGTYQRFAVLAEPLVRCDIRICLDRLCGPIIRSTVWLLEAGDRELGRLDNLELVVSTALNRLAGNAPRLARTDTPSGDVPGPP